MSTIVLRGSTSGAVTLQTTNVISPNITFTLPSNVGNTGQVLATDGSGVLSFITNDGTASFAAANTADQRAVTSGSYANSAFATANSASSYANGAFATANSASSYANGAFATANSASSYANGAFASSNTKLSLTGGTITGNLIVTSNITTGNLIVNDTMNVHGVIVNWHEPSPLTSKGDPGDLAGYISIDDQKIYRCIENYTNGANNIWVYINFTGGTWG
jgi:hypothetical protein